MDESEIIQRIEKYRLEFHEKNRRRIKTGIICLIAVPLIFLALLMMTGSDRIIFLVLWVISMFIIACYLIYTEYMDFSVDRIVSDITGISPEKPEPRECEDSDGITEDESSDEEYSENN